MTESTPRPRADPRDAERTRRRAQSRGAVRWSGVRRLVRLGIGGAGFVVLSATASAHEFGHGAGHGGGTAAFAVVLGVPTLAGLASGVAAVRYRSRRGSEAARGSNIAVGLLLVGLGAASLLPAATGHPRLSVAGGIVGATIAMRVVGDGAAPGIGCGNHAELTLGAVSAHRLLEGVVLGTLYSAGSTVGLLGAAVLAGHTALETAAVGGVYATAPRRTRAVGAIALVQASYIGGAVASLGAAGVVPASVRTLALATAGGALVVVGAVETERSVGADGRRSSANGRDVN